MNTEVVIFLVSAVVGIALALFQHHRLNRVAMDAERRHQRAVALREIKATITVYDVVDGREVNRRAAYPFDRLAMSMQRVGDATEKFTRSLSGLAEAFKTFEDKGIM